MCETYQIRIRGHVERDWSNDTSMTVLPLPNGETLLVGVLDQSALHGVLNRLRDLNLKLIAVSCVDESSTQ